MRKCFLFLFFLTSLIASGQADTGEIHGRVVSARVNEALGLVQVQLQDPSSDTNTAFRAVTFADGTFEIAGVPPGSYILQTTTVGYYLLRQEFTLAAGESKTFDLSLIHISEPTRLLS